METIGQNITGNVNVTGLLDVDNINVDGNLVSSTAGDLNLTSFTGVLNVSGSILPNADNSRDLGATALRYANAYLSNSINENH